MSQAESTAWVDFKRLKSRVSIIQILHHYDALAALQKSGGDRYSGICPIHGGTNKTHFRVSASKNCWNCFGACKRGGNIIDFVMAKEGLELRPAALLIEEWFPEPHSEREARLPSKDAQEPDFSVLGERPRFPLASEEPSAPEESDPNPVLKFALKGLDAKHPYLSERQLSKQTIKEFGIGYCKKGLLRGYIAIPVHNADGELVAYAGRWPGDPPQGGKYKLPPEFRKSRELFNAHRAIASREKLPIVMVEGFFDCIRLVQAGYQRAVAIMGSSLSDYQAQTIARIGRDHGVLLLFDDDDAGRACQKDALIRLAHEVSVRSLRLPDGVRQPDGLTDEQVRTLLQVPSGEGEAS